MNANLVTYGRLVNATVMMDNSADESRTYDIQANVTMRDNKVETVNSGEVRQNGENTLLATFYAMSKDRLSVDYNVENGSRAGVTQEIDNYLERVTAKVAVGNPWESGE